MNRTFTVGRRWDVMSSSGVQSAVSFWWEQFSLQSVHPKFWEGHNTKRGWVDSVFTSHTSDFSVWHSVKRRSVISICPCSPVCVYCTWEISRVSPFDWFSTGPLLPRVQYTVFSHQPEHSVLWRDGWWWKTGRKTYSTWSQAVMDNLAASAHPGYFKRSHPVAFEGCILL